MISKKFNLITLMPPKTASTSLKITLENQGIIFDFHKQKLPQSHLKLSEIENFFSIEDLSRYKIIQIVRNPYHRFVSSYFFFKKRIPQNYSPIFKNLNISDFLEHLMKSKKSENFIKNFFGDTKYTDFQMTNGLSWGGTRMFDTQKSWNDRNSKIYFFSLESLCLDISPLNEVLKTSIKNLYKINTQDIKIDYMEFLTEKDRSIIHELYFEDFLNFGYKF